MQAVLARPALLFPAVGPQNARNGSASQYQQGAECLALGAEQRALLCEHAAPVRCKSQEGLQKGVLHGAAPLLTSGNWHKHSRQRRCSG